MAEVAQHRQGQVPVMIDDNESRSGASVESLRPCAPVRPLLAWPRATVRTTAVDRATSTRVPETPTRPPNPIARFTYQEKRKSGQFHVNVYRASPSDRV